MDVASNIKELLSRGEPEKAVKELQKAFPDKTEVNEIAEQFNSSKKNYLKSLLTQDEYHKAVAKVVLLIRDFTDNLEPFRLLYIFSNPSNKAPLSFQDEARAFEEALKGQDFIKLIPKPALQRNEFFKVLREHRPHFVHLSMHGDEEKGVYFRAENGLEDIMSPEELKKHFAVAIKEIEIPVECVVLSCCNSMEHARSLSENIPYAIGMNGLVTAPLAKKFVEEFYAVLTKEKKYSACFNSFMHVLDTTDDLKKYASVPKLFKNT
jgi:hypothetical protein